MTVRAFLTGLAERRREDIAGVFTPVLRRPRGNRHRGRRTHVRHAQEDEAP